MVPSNPTEPAAVQQLSLVISEFVAEMVRSSADDLLRLMQRADLSMPRVVALTYLDRSGAASISQISECLNLALGTTSHIVDQLVSAGYVSRVEDPNDRRQKLVALTPTGTAFVAEVRQVRADEIARRLAALPEPLVEQALTVMAEVTQRLKAP